MALAANRMLTPFGSSLGSAAKEGPVHLGGAPNALSNPGVTGQPAPIERYFAMLGVPDAIAHVPTENLPVTSHSIASLFDGAEPTMIKKYVIEATLLNELFQHFVVCPPIDTKNNLKGIGTHVLRFGVAPLSPQPEGSSTTYIRHKFEKTEVTLARWGQGLELWDDFTLTPDGEAIYQAYLNNLNTNMTYSGMMAVMTALLHAYDTKKTYMQQYARGHLPSDQQDLGDYNYSFGGFHKYEKYFQYLADYASQVAGKQATGSRFTHAFLTSKPLRQYAFADQFNSEYSRHGPGNLRALDMGTEAIRRTPDGTILVKEPDSYVDGTDLRPGESVQLLRQRVTTGRFNAVLLDPTLVGYGIVDPRRDMQLSYLDMNIGEGGQITQTKPTELIRSLVCWDVDGELHRRAYSHLTSGQNAENLARTLGESGPPRAADNSSLIDVFIVEAAPGIRVPVRIVGNMHSAYMDPESQNSIARSAAAAVNAEMKQNELAAMDEALRFAERNKNADPTSQATVAFANAMMGPYELAAGVAQAVAGQRHARNIHGVYPIPALTQVDWAHAEGLAPAADNAWPIPRADTIVFPGYSSIKHLRTVRDFVMTRPPTWYAVLNPGQQHNLQVVADGVDALEKFARICKRIWSPDPAPNTFFRRNALPAWNRSNNGLQDDIDAFLQNIVLGIGYPTAMRLDGAPAGMRQNQDPLYLDFRVPANVTDARVNSFIDLIRGNAVIPAAERRVILQAAYVEDMFGNAVDAFFPPVVVAAPGVAANAGRTADNAPTERQFLEQNFRDLVIDDEGTETTGFAAAMAIIEPRIALPAGANADGRETFIKARIRSLASIYMKMEQERGDQAPGTPVRLPATVAAATVTTAVMLAKRKFTTYGEPESSVAAQRRVALGQGLRAANQQPADQLINTYLSFSATAWQNAYSGRDAAALEIMPLLATDPANPGVSWLGHGPLNNANDAARQFFSMAAREKYSLDETCMGKIAGAAFVHEGDSNSVEPPKKRQYVPSMLDEDGFGSEVTAGARYVSIPPERDPYQGMPPGVRNRMRLDADGDVDMDRVSVIGPYSTAPHRMSQAVLQEANPHFQWRWRHAVSNFSSDIILLAQHLLLLGQRVHRESFVTAVMNGVPAPVGMVALNPFVTFNMTHVVFARAGCGNLFYAFPELSSNYDGNHKVLRCYLTVWMKAHVHLADDVYVAENQAFDDYLGGGSGNLIRNVYDDEAEYAEEPVGGWYYDPENPSARRGDRFIVPVGISTQLRDLPNPFPLTGSFGGPGAYHGIGRFINLTNGDPVRRGLLYDSALVTNFICKFYLLNPGWSINSLSKAPSFADRGDRIGMAWNTICYMADQWAYNTGDGGYKRRAVNGTGCLGHMSEGSMFPYSGKVGLNQYVIANGP